MPALQQLRDEIDRALRARLDSLSAADKEYWAFRGNSRRGNAHAFFQYPAMMVPQMQGELIRVIKAVKSDLESAFDPFVGSGTTLTEAMLHGLCFTGWDVNPLAILLCKTKIGPFYPVALREKLSEVLSRAKEDTSISFETSLPNTMKWFRRDVAHALSRLRRAIRRENAPWARRFFWVALADAVRLSSNSRTSTFKLHVRPKEEIEARRSSPTQLFEVAAVRNIQQMDAQCTILKERGLLLKGRYCRDVETWHGDSSKPSQIRNQTAKHDLMITSPPYGDNKSTVPYGQYSYLPLNWIDGTDIDPAWDGGLLRTTHEIDTRSLGGVLHGADAATRELSAKSPAFSRFQKVLEMAPKDRMHRVAAFCRDLDHALLVILKELKIGAYMVWTVGNRRVGGQSFPLDEIMSDLLFAQRWRQVAKISRPILSKRMAVKNSVSGTMRTESVMVFRK